MQSAYLAGGLSEIQTFRIGQYRARSVQYRGFIIKHVELAYMSSEKEQNGAKKKIGWGIALAIASSQPSFSYG